MSEKIQPALTAKQWKEYLSYEPWEVANRVESLVQSDGNDAGAAALLLHGQPFGFTREDVYAIRRMANFREAYLQEWGEPPEDEINRTRSLADRIESLLSLQRNERT